MKRSLTVLIGLVGCLTWAIAQDIPKTAPVAPAAPAVQPAPTPAAPPPTPAATPAGTEVKTEPAESEGGVWEYKDADLQTVLTALALRSNVNILIGDGVTGRVTILLRNVTAMEAMRVIVESKGFVLREEKNLLKVLTRDAADTGPTEQRVYTVAHAKAADMAVLIQPNLTRQGRITVDPRSNALILTDTKASLDKAVVLIQQLDTQSPQVLIEAKFFDTSRDVGKILGVDWSGVMTKRSISITGGGTTTPGTGGTGGTGSSAAGFLHASKDLNVGVPWTWPTMVIDAGNLAWTLDFFNTDADTDTLASPRIVALNRVKARIAVSEQIPIPSFTFNTTKGAYEVSGFEWKDIGTILEVTPQINKDGYITMDVAPTVNVLGENPIAAQGFSINSVKSRSATTTVLIKSGNTLVIGGLNDQTVTESYNKVPIMGDIPGLGAMFRHRNLRKIKRNLVVFLTPKLVNPDMSVIEAEVTKPMLEPVFTNDKWMPNDNAKPRSYNAPAKSTRPASTPTTVNPANQNFGPKKD